MSEAALAPAAPNRSLTWDDMNALVLDSVTSPHSKRAYARVLDEFFRWGREQDMAGQGTAFGKALIQRYRAALQEKRLAPSSTNVRLAALRELATEAADNGVVDPAVASAIARVKGAVQKGRRIGRWLTRDEASLLLRDSGQEGLKAKRDRALLCLLVGAGLRREELVSLEVGHIQQRDGRWAIVDLIGKRKRIRTVPIPAWTKAIIDHWTTAAGITEGKLFRAVGKSGRLAGERLSAQAVYLVVTDSAKKIGLELAPHDARRTFAKLAHKGRVLIEQIQLALGRESIQTTERYLGIEQDLINAPGEYLGIEVE